MNNQWHIAFASFSGIGKRANNEDTLFSEINKNTGTNLFMVCDGVGGQNKGEVASSLLASSFAEYLQNNANLENTDWVQDAIKFTEAKFDNYQQNNPDAKGMASTLALLLLKENKALVAHCGDSRIYHFRENKIIFQTKDHSYTNWLIDRGELTPEQAISHPKKNVITRCIAGAANPTQAEIHEITEVKVGDYFLLCSDGVLEAWQQDELTELINNNSDAQLIVNKLSEQCNSLSNDNFTGILIKITL